MLKAGQASSRDAVTTIKMSKLFSAQCFACVVRPPSGRSVPVPAAAVVTAQAAGAAIEIWRWTGAREVGVPSDVLSSSRKRESNNSVLTAAQARSPPTSQYDKSMHAVVARRTTPKRCSVLPRAAGLPPPAAVFGDERTRSATRAIHGPNMPQVSQFFKGGGGGRS